MKKYIIKRFLQLIPILIGITLLSFILMHSSSMDAVDVMEQNTGGSLSDEEKAAIREELGLDVRPEQLHYAGKHRGAFEAVFHGKMFRDNEISSVYVYTDPVEIEQLTLQEEELEEVRWMDYEECHRRILDGSLPNCIYEDEFRMVGEYLKETDMK